MHRCPTCGDYCACDGTDEWREDSSPEAQRCWHCLDEIVGDLGENDGILPGDEDWDPRKTTMMLGMRTTVLY